LSASIEATHALQAGRKANADDFARRLKPTLERLGRRQYHRDHQFSLRLTGESEPLTSEDMQIMAELAEKLDAVGASAAELLDAAAVAYSKAIRGDAFRKQYEEQLAKLPTLPEFEHERLQLKAEREQFERDMKVKEADLEHRGMVRQDAEAGIAALDSLWRQADTAVRTLIVTIEHPDHASIRPGFRRMNLPV
jgi:hypothetical protein